MTKDTPSQPDWATGRHRDILVWQRKQMWAQDQIERLAAWVGWQQGMTAVDVGCGLGYLGYTYWPYFGEGGQYIGIDLSPALLRDAAEEACTWAAGGSTAFAAGSAYAIPVADAVADVVMCQTVMIHLAEPKRALSEMMRVLKPGGLVVCKEPDNLAGILLQPYSSLPKPDTKMRVLTFKMHLIAAEGRIKLGRGDHGIGPKIPHLLAELGAEVEDIRIRDVVSYLEPPYGSERQQWHLENLKKHVVSEQNYREQMKEFGEEFLAGGGDPEELETFLTLSEQMVPIHRRQLDEGEFHVCGAYPVYVIKARKPA